MSTSITVALSDAGIATLRLDQPNSRANVLTLDLWSELATRLQEVAAQPQVRALRIESGKPGMFIAGADLRLLEKTDADSRPAIRELLQGGSAVLDQLAHFPRLTVAQIDGVALGGGLEVALACDRRICGTHPKITLGLPETRFGLIPGWGGTQRLPRLVDPLFALERLVSADSLGSMQALQVGLIHAIFALDQERDSLERWIIEQAQATDWREQRERLRQPQSLPVVSAAEIVERLRPLATPALQEQPTLVDEIVGLVLTGLQEPLEVGMQREQELFFRLAGTPTSAHWIREFFRQAKTKTEGTPPSEAKS